MAATLIAQGITLERAAPQVGAKNANSLKVGLARRGVSALAVRRSDPALARAVTIATRVITQESEAQRKRLATQLAETTEMLAKVPQRANIKAIKPRLDALEVAARTAKIVHNWGDEQSNAMVFAGEFDARQIIETPQAQLSAPIGIPPVVVSGEPENVQSQSVVATTPPTTDN